MNYNIEHERAVIAGLIRDNTAYDQLNLKANDFYSGDYASTYRAIEIIIQDGRIANELSIADELLKSNINPAFLGKLDPVTAANISYYADSVKEISKKRKLEQLTYAIQDSLKSGKVSEEIIEEIERGITQLIDTSDNDMKWIKDVLFPVVRRIEEDYKNGGRLRGISSGYSGIDALTNGFEGGELIIIGARPSIGKTALALSMALKMALKNIATGFFSCEMASVQLVSRLISGEARVNLRYSKKYKNEDFDRIITAAGRLYSASILIDDTANISLVKLKSKARKMKRLGIKIVFVDYLTLIQYGNQQMPGHEKIGAISKSLKQLARELNIPVVVMSQVNRDAEGKMPTLAHLRLSGAIEEDADIIMFLHRKRNEFDTNLNVAKNRNGPTDTVKLVFLPELIKFESWTEA